MLCIIDKRNIYCQRRSPMNNFKQKFDDFMYGRYGNDTFNFGLFIAWVVLSIFTIFFHGVIYRLITLIPLAFLIFRFLSKNTSQRENENKMFLIFCKNAKLFFADFKQWWFKTERWFNLQKRRWQERKTHRYIHCPHCRTVMRVPFKKGKHTICCPKCR